MSLSQSSATRIEYVMCSTCDERTCLCAQPSAPSLEQTLGGDEKTSDAVFGEFCHADLKKSSGKASTSCGCKILTAEFLSADSGGFSCASSSSTTSSWDKAAFVYKLPRLEILDDPPKKSRRPLTILVKKKKPWNNDPNLTTILSMDQRQSSSQGEQKLNEEAVSQKISGIKRKLTSSVEMMYGKKQKN